MSVLYRTYRPSKWGEVIGQDQVVEPLKDSITNKRIAHAYLFSGSRGTGKTSVARILAKSVDTNDEDVYEIDAASNRGIDDIRSLREHVAVLPFSSAFKVYIIDEVHMLSKDAWNALLKTLEEPPKHVIFILATTAVTSLVKDAIGNNLSDSCSAQTLPFFKFWMIYDVAVISESLDFGRDNVAALIKPSSTLAVYEIIFLKPIRRISSEVSFRD